jgi:hypothetical protein
MTTPQQHGEPERQEGLGGRVRRFINSEFSRAMDRQDRRTDESNVDYRDEYDSAAEFDQHQASSNPRAGESARADHPVMTTQADAGLDPPVRTASVEEPEPDTARSRSEAAADGSATRVGLLNNPAGLRNEWQRVQGTFVDDPQRAVHEASALVDRTLREIQENVSRGQISDPTSTEDLRVSFQRYREFFQRLLSA